MNISRLPAWIAGLTILTGAGSAQAAQVWESAPTPQAQAMNAAFMEFLPAPTQPVTVCMIDTGVDLTGDTTPIVTARYTVMGDGQLDDIQPGAGHGTAVASIMGGPRNGVGGVGLWPGVKVISVRATSTVNSGEAIFTWTDYWRGFRPCLADPTVKVINLSLGGQPAGILDELTATNLVDRAHQGGVSVVASAGNRPGAPMAPANVAGVVGVAASNPGAAGALCWFSASAPGILAAPGCGVEVAGRGNEVYTWDGTSFSAPLVSTVLAALRAYNPSLTYQQAEDLVRGSSHPSPDGTTVLVDAEASFRAAGLGGQVDQAKAALAAVNPQPSGPGGASPAPGSTPPPAGPVNTFGLVSAPRAARVLWTRRTSRGLVIRLAPLPRSVRLQVRGVGRVTRVNATTLRAAYRATGWRLVLRTVSRSTNMTSVARVVKVPARSVVGVAR